MGSRGQTEARWVPFGKSEFQLRNKHRCFGMEKELRGRVTRNESFLHLRCPVLGRMGTVF